MDIKRPIKRCNGLSGQSSSGAFRSVRFFSRTLYKFQFLTALDLDEVIVPLKADNWTRLMETFANNADYPSYAFRNAYFLDDFPVDESVPEHFHILRHTHRSVNYTSINTHLKSFQRTNAILSMHNHLHK